MSQSECQVKLITEATPIVTETSRNSDKESLPPPKRIIQK